jgi:NAD-dependent SIR2 family protein deacetylase
MGSLPYTGNLQTGEIAPPGTYACMNCPHTSQDDKAMVILSKRGKLPRCPVCEKPTYWIKL